MNQRLWMKLTLLLVLIANLSLSGCFRPTYDMSNYEDSLYFLSEYPNGHGLSMATAMLSQSIVSAELVHVKVPPGVYADLGYLFWQAGKLDESVAALKKEREMYPESHKMTDWAISRIQSAQPRVGGVNR